MTNELELNDVETGRTEGGQGNLGEARKRDVYVPPRRTAFTVDDRLTIMIDVDLAEDLVAIIMASKTENPAIWALGQQLRKAVDG